MRAHIRSFAGATPGDSPTELAMAERDRYLRTPDGRYFVLRQRLWRLSNPALPATVRKSLVADLMAARRAVRLADGDPERLALARRAVNRAKVALGERGVVWWRDGAPDFNRRRVGATPYAAWFRRAIRTATLQQWILACLARRAEDASACPSEIAREVAAGQDGSWRQWMDPVRRAAAALARNGRIVITRGDRLLSPGHLAGGPIRFRRGPRFQSTR